MSIAEAPHRRHVPPQVPDVAIVIPTYNENDNVTVLASQIARVMGAAKYEIIFVDDHSPDGTAETVRKLAQQDARINVIERFGERGLSTAVIEGLMSTNAPFGVVIDGDLQHDVSVIPFLIEALQGGADLAIGSRHIAGGGTGEWSRFRKQASFLATRLSFLAPAARVSDPMSGFFAIRTEVFRARADQLIGTGYKILLDILTTRGAPLRTEEVAYVFRPRQKGESKLEALVALEFVRLLLARTVGQFLPVRFVMFLLVGALGIGVHFLALAVLFSWLPFSHSQTGATLVAMTGNFLLNNWFTYSDIRLKGWRILGGWLSFCAASSAGLIANIAMSAYLYSYVQASWYAAAFSGILVGAAWNYVTTARFTWKS